MVQWQIKSNFRSISEQLQSKIVSLIRSVFGLRCFPLAVADSGANKSNYIKLDFKTTQSCSSGKLEAVRVQPFNNSFFFLFCVSSFIFALISITISRNQLAALLFTLFQVRIWNHFRALTLTVSRLFGPSPPPIRRREDKNMK